MFTVAAFIQPKQVITSFQYDREMINKIISKQYDIIHKVSILDEFKENFHNLPLAEHNDLVLNQLTEDFYGHLSGQSL